MTASAEILAALNQTYGSASSKAFLAAIAEGEGGRSFLTLFGDSVKHPNLWAGSLDAFPPWPGVQLANGRMTHAAGAFQFQPASYAGIIVISGRSGFYPQDQIQNAWDFGDHTFHAGTAIPLHTVLEAGAGGNNNQLLLIPTYLGRVWIGGCDSEFPKRFIKNLPLVRTLSPNSLNGSPLADIA